MILKVIVLKLDQRKKKKNAPDVAIVFADFAPNETL